MAQTRTLQSIKRIRVPVVLPAGSEPHGQTPEGVPLYRLVRKRSRSVPDYEPIHSENCGWDHRWMDDTVKEPVCLDCHIKGHQRHNKHALTGQELVGLRKPVVYEEELIFTWEDQLNGNAGPLAYVPPSADEIAAKDRAKRRAEMQDALLEAMAESGLEPADVISALRGEKTEYVDRVTEEAVEPAAEYPNMYAPGRWRLSNGETVQGKKIDALEAEAAVQATRRIADSTPEY